MSTVLADEALTATWNSELALMSDRIIQMVRVAALVVFVFVFVVVVEVVLVVLWW